MVEGDSVARQASCGGASSHAGFVHVRELRAGEKAQGSTGVSAVEPTLPRSTAEEPTLQATESACPITNKLGLAHTIGDSF